MRDFDRLCRQIGYQFSDQDLLSLALTHRSYSGKKNNERLEFLGDSVLNFIIGKALFDRFPEAKEGQLSRLRASLVKGETLTEIGRQLELDQHILVGPGELKCGGARRASIIADAVEAILGAIFEESGFERCREIILKLFDERLSSLTISDTVKDNKTRLQEYLQSRRLSLPKYQIKSVSGQSHNQQFYVECTVEGVDSVFSGSGTSKRQAEQEAAGKALKALLAK